MANFTVGRRRLIILLLLTSVLLLTLDLRGNLVFDRARDAFAVVMSPFETAAQVVTRPVVNAWRAVAEHDDLLEELRRLQEQVDAQRGSEIAARNAIIENQRLLALNDLESLADFPTVTASIIGQSPSNLDQIVEIDRGSLQGIEVGMPVVNEAGLVGKVTEVFPNSSFVMLVTDTRYAVRVKVLSEEIPVAPIAPPATVPSGLDVVDVTTTTSTTTTTTVPETFEPDGDDEPDVDPDDADVDPDATAGDRPAGGLLDDLIGSVTTTSVAPVLVERETGALRGQGGNRLPLVTFVASNPVLGQISVGDTVSTAGGRESLAPPDIPVGVVRNVISRPGSAGTELEVELGADVSRLQFVRVVVFRPLAEVEG
jgi:rod shape-determining protein MreC